MTRSWQEPIEAQSSALSQQDLDLCRQAGDLLRLRHDAGRHRVAAAARGASGRVYLGLHLASPRINICAEPAAIANACAAGEREIDTIVAMGMGADGIPCVINPCGVCRELIPAYGSAHVIVRDHGGTRAVSASSLMPIPWVRAQDYR